MKKHNKTLNNIIEEISKKHLGVNIFMDNNNHNLSSSLIKIALIEAVKSGERVGYDKGYSDAKTGCNKETCDCEHSFVV